MKIVIEVLGGTNLWENHPTYKKAKKNEDVGLDIPILNDVIIPAGAISFKIPLGIKTEPTHGYMLIPRSSIIKTTMRLANSVGIIDKSYRGEVMAVVDNIGVDDVHLKTGSCYFQIVTFDGNLPTYTLKDELSSTTRGSGGFGSTTNLDY
jgi:dUTP pyrophosphatase